MDSLQQKVFKTNGRKDVAGRINNSMEQRLKSNSVASHGHQNLRLKSKSVASHGHQNLSRPQPRNVWRLPQRQSLPHSSRLPYANSSRLLHRNSSRLLHNNLSLLLQNKLQIGLPHLLHKSPGLQQDHKGVGVVSSTSHPRRSVSEPTAKLSLSRSGKTYKV